MPTMSGNLTALRSSHTARVYMSLLTGSSVLTGTVSADADETSALNVAYTLDTGSASNVLPGYRVAFYTSTGYYKGTTSIRYAGTISSTNIPIRELSSGEILVVSGDTFEVWDDVVLSDKLPSADTSFSPDHTTYSDQNSNPPPIACSGGNWAGWLGSGGTVDVPFYGSDSYTVDPDSAGTGTHLWVCASGTWDDDASATPVLTLTSAGKYTVFHYFTDDTNSKTDLQIVRVRVHDAADPPYECLLSNNSGDPQGGFGVTMTLFASADLVTIPDLAPVLVWQDQTLAGAPASYGAKVASRSHVVLNGFFRRDRGRGSGDTGLEEIEFEVINPLARLGELPGFSKVMLRNQSPSDWQSIKTLTVKRAIIHLLRNYTNIAQICDLVFDGFPDAAYPAFYVQKQTTLEQARELADSRGGRIICDRTGRIEVQLRIEFTPLVSRTSLDTTISLGQLDIIDYELSRDHAGALETYRARGFTAATDETSAAPLFARFPASPARGSQASTIDKLICDDQADLFNQCALRGAWENAVFYEAGGIHHRAPEVRLTLFGGYAHLFQFYRELVFVQLLTNMRGITTLTYRFIPQSVSVDYDGQGSATTTLVMRAETHASGAYAVDDTPASDLSYANTDYPIPFTLPLTSTPSDGVLTGGTQRIVGINTDGYAYLTSNFDTANPTWTRVALAVSGTIQDSVGDAFTSNRIIVATTTNLYTLDAPRGAATLTDRFTFPSSTGTGSRSRSLEASFGAAFFFVISGYGNTGGHTGTWYTYSTDGETWATETQAAAQYETGAGAYNPGGLYLSSRTPGTGVFSAVTTTGLQSAAEAHLFSIAGYGASVAQISSPSDYVPGDVSSYGIHVPFHDNASDAIVYFNTFRYVSAPDVIMRRKNADGTVSTDISPQKGGDKLGARDHRSLHTCPIDRLSVIVCATNSGGTSRSGVFVSRDGGDTWSELTSATTTDYMRAEFAGDNRSIAYLWGNSGAVGLAKYTAGVWAIGDKRGNIPTDYPSAGKFTRLYGM